MRIYDQIKENQIKLEETNEKLLRHFWSFAYKREFQFNVFNEGTSEEFSQKDIINSLIKGNDTIAIMKTSGGKSLCYQSVSYLTPGLTIMITPLVELIKDQVKEYNKYFNCEYSDLRSEDDSFKIKKYRAVSLSDNMGNLQSLLDEIADSQGAESDSEIKLLVLSPEKINNPKFLRTFTNYIGDTEYKNQKHINVRNIIFDEAHCLSLWGYSFREDYLKVGRLINNLKFSKRPVIGVFSATMTKSDVDSVKNLLHLKNPKEYVDISPRENLDIYVVNCEDKEYKGKKNEIVEVSSRFASLKWLLQKHREENIIIYCTSTETVDFLRAKLSHMERTDDKNIVDTTTYAYHAKMSKKARNRASASFLSPKIAKRRLPKKIKERLDREKKLRDMNLNRILISTKAFGMGINKKDITVIIHFDMPTSIEDYYQEIGRAARDKNLTGSCYLLYSKDTYGRVDKHYVKGTLKNNVEWYLDSVKAPANEAREVYSRFPEEVKNTLNMYTLYRMCKMWDFCENHGFAHGLHNLRPANPEVLTDYFREETIDYSLFEKFKCFYNGLREEKLGHVIDEDHPDYKYFYVEKKSKSKRKQKNNDINKLSKGVVKTLDRVNELHINNCLIANVLRDNGLSGDIVYANEMHTLQVTEGRTNKVENNIKSGRKKVSALTEKDIHEESLFLYVPKNTIMQYSDSLVNKLWKNYQAQNNLDNAENVSKNRCIYVVNRNYTLSKAYRWDESQDKWMLKEEKTGLLAGKYSVYNLVSANEQSSWEKCVYKFVDTKEYDPSATYFIKVSGQRALEYTFCVKSKRNRMPSYFDMCVMDAVYSILINDLSGIEDKVIYPQVIWEVLSGNTKEASTFTGGDSKIKKAITDSLDYLSSTHLYAKVSKGMVVGREDGSKEILTESEKEFGKINEPFLRLQKNDSKYIYKSKDYPVLFEVAHYVNGEILRVPVNLFKKSWELQTWAHTVGSTLVRDEDIEVSDKYKEDMSHMGKLIESNTGRIPSKNPYFFVNSIYTTCLMHYLIRRVKIYNSNRVESAIRFDTVKKVILPYEEKYDRNDEILYTKILTLLSYYNHIGYLNSTIAVRNKKTDVENSDSKRKPVFTKKYSNYVGLCIYKNNYEFDFAFLDDKKRKKQKRTNYFTFYGDSLVWNPYYLLNNQDKSRCQYTTEEISRYYSHTRPVVGLTELDGINMEALPPVKDTMPKLGEYDGDSWNERVFPEGTKITALLLERVSVDEDKYLNVLASLDKGNKGVIGVFLETGEDTDKDKYWQEILQSIKKRNIDAIEKFIVSRNYSFVENVVKESYPEGSVSYFTHDLLDIFTKLEEDKVIKNGSVKNGVKLTKEQRYSLLYKDIKQLFAYSKIYESNKLSEEERFEKLKVKFFERIDSFKDRWNNEAIKNVADEIKGKYTEEFLKQLSYSSELQSIIKNTDNLVRITNEIHVMLEEYNKSQLRDIFGKLIYKKKQLGKKLDNLRNSRVTKADLERLQKNKLEIENLEKQEFETIKKELSDRKAKSEDIYSSLKSLNRKLAKIETGTIWKVEKKLNIKSLNSINVKVILTPFAKDNYLSLDELNLIMRYLK